MIKRIIAYLLLGLGAVILIFFSEYKGTFTFSSFVYVLTGLLLEVSGGILLRRDQSRKGSLDRKEQQQLIGELKRSGRQIKVNLSHCEVKENSYIEEREKYGTENYFATSGIERNIQALNALTDETRNVQRVQVNQAVLIYHHEEEGQSRRFVSGVLPFERTTLLMKLVLQKETTLYIDREDPSKYYFDLEFLFV